MLWSVTAVAADRQPNLVVVLTDDLDAALVDELPDLLELVAEPGMRFDNAFVSVSLCCPSRATLLRGQYAHSTGVYGNHPPLGGYEVFHDRGAEESTVATWLHDAGYRTVFLGKYLNGYPGPAGPLHIPPGWDQWVSAAGGRPYTQYDYALNVDGRREEHGHKPKDYLTDVLAKFAVEAVKDAHRRDEPLFLYVSTFAPHHPADAAPRHERRFRDAQAPRDPSFDEADVSDKPPWIRGFGRLGNRGEAACDRTYGRRIRSMLAVTDLVARIRDALAKAGELEDTVFVFTSDNGYHTGQHRLSPGKNTPYDTDLRVPLFIAGPGIAEGSRSDLLVGNVDLAPTLADLGGARVPEFVEGRSLVPVLKGRSPAWRQAFLLEHEGSDALDPEADEEARSTREPLDPGDNTSNSSKALPAFLGLRTPRYTFVMYPGDVHEVYDNEKDPFQLDNLAGTVSPSLLAAFERRALALRECAGERCRELEDDEVR